MDFPELPPNYSWYRRMYNNVLDGLCEVCIRYQHPPGTPFGAHIDMNDMTEAVGCALRDYRKKYLWRTACIGTGWGPSHEVPTLQDAINIVAQMIWMGVLEEEEGK